MTHLEVEERIKDFFEENYELLRLEGGHALSEKGKQDALEQVLLYWRKLNNIAEKVTESEVKLTLPDQKTKKGKIFSIEGIVDIVREDDETWMYDIKTHDLDYIRNNKDLYEKQLNVYAYIWQHLRGNELDRTAIISTSIPYALKDAMQKGNQKQIDTQMKEWDPLVPLDFNSLKVEDTIADFARIVDLIEDHEFMPQPVLRLREKQGNTNELFATRVCRNCDARYSCVSFREYALGTNASSNIKFRQYFQDYGTDGDQEDWVNANLQTEPER
ncbi:MAG TPA: PD-(D/E)XK nuclease family protein [Chitinophagales bacterium]|nr:PD-(D/E)XK nuclease family protein [Chitinophagales bacterium]